MNLTIIIGFLAGAFVFDFFPMIKKGNVEKRKIVLYIAAAVILIVAVVLFILRIDFPKLSSIITKFINSIIKPYNHI